MKKWLFILCLAGFLPHVHAQTPVLDQLITEGLASNAAMQQAGFRLNQQIAALQEAKGIFLPHLSLMADYTLAQGGRRIDLPVGTLLNPVYGTLNQLTQSQAFPQIENVSEQFLPNNFHDSKIRTSMPLFNRTASLNAAIRAEAVKGAEAAIRVYQRKLIQAIREAYFQWLKAGEGIRILKSAEALLRDNLQLTERLIQQGLALPAARLQVQRDLSALNSQLSELQHQEVLATMQINFLLNRNAETPVTRDTTMLQTTHPWQQTLSGNPTMNQREELQELASGLQQTRLAERLHRASGLPELAAFADLGFQGFGFNLGDRQAYALGGLSLRWNLFQGNQSRYRQQQARFQQQELTSKTDETQRLLQLELEQATRKLSQATTQLNAINEQLKLAEELYRLTQVRYQQGQALPIELSQALQQYTTAKIQQRLSLTDRLIARAEWERVAAQETLPTTSKPSNRTR